MSGYTFRQQTMGYMSCAGAATACTPNDVITNWRELCPGLYFPPNQPLTRSHELDQQVFTALCNASWGEKLVHRIDRAAHLLMECNRYWKACENVVLEDFWEAMGQLVQYGQKQLDANVVHQLVVLLVKGRQRFLIRYPDKSHTDIDKMLVAYTHMLLQKLLSERVRSFGERWRLTAREEAIARAGLTPMGPARQISKNKYQLSPNANNPLYNIAEIAGKGKTKANLMGMATVTIGEPPTQAMVSKL